MTPRPGILSRYAAWLHTGWPAGRVERLPVVGPDGRSGIPGLFIVGDLAGIPLLKFSADSGARAVQAILADPGFRRTRGTDPSVADLVIIGAGVSGMAAALEAQAAGLDPVILEAAEPFSTLVNFPRGKPIFTYPTGMVPAGSLQFTADTRETLLTELRAQTAGRGIRPRIMRVESIRRAGDILEVQPAGAPPIRARRVIAAIGRSGDHRKLGVPGEERDKVSNRLHDPKDFAGRDVLVVGGGDSAVETAIAVAEAGGRVTLSYRGRELARPKPGNTGRLRRMAAGEGAHRPVVLLGSTVQSIGERDVTLTDADGRTLTIPNDAVFTMIGREAPLAFFRRAGTRIAGEMGRRGWTAFTAFFLFCLFVYTWKAGGAVTRSFEEQGWFPFNVPAFITGLGPAAAAAAADRTHLLGTMMVSLREGGFYYALVYTLLVTVFGVLRIRRRRTPYITRQTLTLMAVQCIPLFLLPYVFLPWMGNNGMFDAGAGKAVADALFPAVTYGHGREYWRAFGLILAWPLFVWNVFTSQPLWWWLGISLVQTLVLIPAIVLIWGKGAYCGWICSCGAMAETLGDTHRQKMPHGPGWNRLNMTGQVILAIAVVLLLLRVLSWAAPETGAGRWAGTVFGGLFQGWSLGGVQLNYKYVVDLFLAGAVGYGAYFWFSGRVWCRFACPLAAFMHIIARVSRFRILADKKKCISCNVCTSVCHQGIDVMSFANRGLPMADPECVRCSACVHSCPTGVLQFGQVDTRSGEVIRVDRLPASPVLMREDARD